MFLDARMVGWWVYGVLDLLRPIHLHPPIRGHISQQLPSHCCISSRIYQFQSNLSQTNIIKLIIIECQKSSMLLKGLKQSLSTLLHTCFTNAHVLEIYLDASTVHIMASMMHTILEHMWQMLQKYYHCVFIGLLVFK
jgi:hypothetical protein